MTFMDNNQWMLPVGLQILFAGLLAPVAMLGKESPRWYAAVGRNADALKSLEWIHSGAPGPAQDEMIRIEVLMTGGQSRAPPGQPSLNVCSLSLTIFPDSRFPALKPLLAGVAVTTAQQVAGSLVFNYYAPQYFQAVHAKFTSANYGLNGVYLGVQVAAALVFTLVVAERLGRRTVLIMGAAVMAIFQLATAGLTHADSSISSHFDASVAFMCLFTIAYNASWGPVSFIYINE